MKKILLKTKTLLSVVLLTAVATIQAADQFVVFQPATDTWQLQSPVITFSPQEHQCVHLAAANLLADFAKVTGTKGIQREEGATILIGTVGVSPQIDQWVKQGELRDLKGKTEKYLIKTIGSQLVIAGSDKRGTVYGIYELSRQMGVSPWYYWADVPVEQHQALYIKKGEYTDGEPAVRYRGLFLNDEAPCLTSWVKNTFGTDYGGHQFYEKVFELILRLKGNYLWPAMWGWAFYADDPENLRTADAMGVMMGTSHHEPMARNHQEYARDRKGWGAWNYATNKPNLDRFFREGIERMKGTDDIVTIGMRGDGDEAMGRGTDTKLLESIINNQRRIIKEVTGRPAKETAQIWALYKEVQDYYDAGLRVPDDVTILLCDDNWGNVRRLPTAEEQKRKGGWGLYYHVDYVGAPRNSKWINVTPIQNMWEQLQLAYNGGIQKLWILNVGDLKPMEYPIQLFMDMAWNPSRYQVTNLLDHTRDFCAESFGKDQACEAASILNLVSKYNGRITSEMLDATTYTTDEFAQVVSEYQALEARALRQFITLRPECRDAYRQIILFPVQAMGNIYEMYYAQAMNNQLAAQGDPDANCWAERCRQAFRRDSLLNLQYNKEIAGGKWDGMMTQKHISYTSWNDNYPRDLCPYLAEVPEPANGPLFSPRDGYISIEAEHTYSRTDAGNAKWTVIPGMGRTLSGVALMPYTTATDNAKLTYYFTAPKDVKTAKVHIITKSTLDFLDKGGLIYDATIDDGQPASINFNSNLNEKPENIYSIYYPTVARRVVEKTVELPLAEGKDYHVLNLHPQDPGIVFEKIVIDFGGYKPQYLFGKESPKLYNADLSSINDKTLPLVYDVENTGADYPKSTMLPAAALPILKALPDPLERVNAFSDWPRRRSEISQLIQHFGLGEKPAVGKEQVKARMDGDTLIVDVTVGKETLTLRSEIRYPATGEAPYALMIGTSGIALPKQLFDNRPIATMVFHEKQVNDYGQWGPHHERGEHNFDRLYPDLKDNGAYSEWAWGLSRLIDGLQLLGPEVTKIDTKHIGVTGCSYAGKMALYCGAFDERVALTIAQEPGGGGAAAWRASHQKDSVENLERTDYHWFLESQRTNFSGDSVYMLPYDQHELCALICPRALLLLGNPDFKWLADDAMLVSAKAAHKVWERFEIADRMGWSIVGGHGHCQLPERQWPEVQAFIDRFLLGRNTNTANVQVFSK